jgi:hypothetical protein
MSAYRQKRLIVLWLTNPQFVMSALALACALLFVLNFRGIPRPITVAMDVRTERCARLQLLYDVPANSGAPESVVRMIDSRERFRKVRISTNAAAIRNVRLIQSGGCGTVRLRHIRLELLGGRVVAIPVSDLRPINATMTLAREGDIAKINGGDGDAGVAFLVSDFVLAPRFAQYARWGIVMALCGVSLGLAWLLRGYASLGSAVSVHAERTIGNGFVVLTIITYIVASVLKLNGSATPLWRYYADRSAPNAGVLLGTPKEIRSDEWMVQTPWIMSQAARHPTFPAVNPGVGEGEMSLLNNLPVRHWSAFFRPQMWGFFLADFEHAFALYWNFKWFGLIIGAFLFLRVICNGQSFIAIFGALLLFFSTFIQWWFSTPTCMPEMLGAVFLGLWSVTVIRRAGSRCAIVAASVLLVIAVEQFVFCSYPRFQVPLFWLALILVASGVAKGKPDLRRWRIYALFSVATITAVLLVCWFREVTPLIRQMASLTYPGRVISGGGGIPWCNFLAPFLEFSMTQEHFRRGAINVCDASGFLFFAPLLAAVSVRDVFAQRRDAVFLAMILYILLMIVFMHFGFPPAVAYWTGFSRVYAMLANLGLAVASIVALCRYLSRDRAVKTAIGSEVLLFPALVVLIIALFYATNEMIGRFVDMATVVAAGVFFAFVFVCLWKRCVVICTILLLTPLIYANALVNPIVHGLSGLTGGQVFRWLQETNRTRPTGKWIVLGRSSRSCLIAQLIKATGANVLGGTRCDPDPAMVRVLDPNARYADVYNRYATISFAPGTSVEPSFEFTFIDSYRVLLPLDTTIFDRLGVTYVLEVDLAEPEGRIAGFGAIGEHEGCRLLMR